MARLLIDRLIEPISATGGHMDAISEVGSFSVVDVMRTDIFTLARETPVVMARQIAREKRVDHLLVLDRGTLAGIVCEHDLQPDDEEDADDDDDAVVGDCMSTPVLCVGPETTLDDAAEIMAEQGVSCLPVVIERCLVGIITRATLARMGLAASWQADAPARRTCVACGSGGGQPAHARWHDVTLCPPCLSRAAPKVGSESTN